VGSGTETRSATYSVQKVDACTTARRRVGSKLGGVEKLRSKKSLKKRGEGAKEGKCRKGRRV